MTDHEKETLRKLAERMKMSQSEYIRYLLAKESVTL
jgi:hypothetical protein